MLRLPLSTFITFLTVGMLAGCDRPMGPIPGNALEGEPAAWPDSWQFTDAMENFLVETNPEDPYSVTLWGVTNDDTFYIAGASSDSRWVGYLLKNPNAILYVAGKLYSARATQVSSQPELGATLSAYVKKYDIDTSEDSNFIEEGGILFRLDPR